MKKIRSIVKLLAVCTGLLIIQTVRLHFQQMDTEGSEDSYLESEKKEVVDTNLLRGENVQQKGKSDGLLTDGKMARNDTRPKEKERPYVSDHLKGINLTEYHLALLQPDKLRSTRRMVYNRLPKCGSITMWNLISRVARKNHFHTVASSIYDPPWVDEAEQQKTVVHINGLREPFIYNRHLCFLDFLKYGYQMPVYINLVRHPVDRFVSSYYYQRDLRKKKLTKEEYDVDVNECLDRNFTHCTLKGTFILIPFFCGHGEECLQRTRRALEKAEENAAQYYGAVGLLEDMESFLKLLGCVIPQYFDGIAQVYKGKKVNKTKNKGATLTDVNREKMTQHMKLEIEFYHFLKDRFYFLINRLKTRCNF